MMNRSLMKMMSRSLMKMMKKVTTQMRICLPILNPQMRMKMSKVEVLHKDHNVYMILTNG